MHHSTQPRHSPITLPQQRMKPPRCTNAPLYSTAPFTDHTAPTTHETPQVHQAKTCRRVHKLFWWAALSAFEEACRPCGDVECTQDSHAIDGSAAVPMRPLDGVGMLWCSNNTKNDIEQLATRVCDMKRAWFVSSRRQ
jgi:hypothetical protein